MSHLAPDEPYRDVAWPVFERTELAVLRFEQVTIPDLPACYDTSNKVLNAAVASGLVVPAGPFLGVYHGDPMGTFDLEVGFPVAEAFEVEQEIEGQVVRASHLPQGPYAALSHLGSYDTLNVTWGDVLTAVRGGGAEPLGIWIESYVSDPAGDASRTDLLLPVVVTEASPE